MRLLELKVLSAKPLFWWVILPLAIIVYTAAWLTPATWWYQPISLGISDVDQGGDPVVSIKRSIKRSFDGRYNVNVWSKVPQLGHVSCAGSDELRYRGGMFEPHEDNLTHWADDPWCSKLQPGQYYAEACWTVLRPFAGIVPDKTVCAISNLFTVHPRERE